MNQSQDMLRASARVVSTLAEVALAQLRTSLQNDTVATRPMVMVGQVFGVAQDIMDGALRDPALLMGGLMGDVGRVVGVSATGSEALAASQRRNAELAAQVLKLEARIRELEGGRSGSPVPLRAVPELERSAANTPASEPSNASRARPARSAAKVAVEVASPTTTTPKTPPAKKGTTKKAVRKTAPATAAAVVPETTVEQPTPRPAAKQAAVKQATKRAAAKRAVTKRVSTKQSPAKRPAATQAPAKQSAAKQVPAKARAAEQVPASKRTAKATNR